MTWFDALMPAMQEILDSVAVHLPPLTQSIGALFAVVLGGVIRGFTGFGAALVIVPIVAIVYDPKTAIALHALIEIPSIMQLLPDATRDCARKTVVPMLFAVLVSLPAGMYFLVTLDAGIMRIVMSVSVLVMVGLLSTGWQYKDVVGLKVAATGGAIGGFFQGAAGVGGPPIVALLLSRHDNSRMTRGNILIMMGSLIVVSLAAQFAYGLFHAEVILLAVFLAPVYVLSTYMGSVLFRHGGDRHYRKGAMIILAITALSTLVGSII